MSTIIDMTGQRFGRLTVIKKLPPGPNAKEARWLCRCDCGGEKIVSRGSLRKGHCKSCGCLRSGGMELVYIKNDRVMKKKYMKHACPYNEGCQCEKMECWKCGWNPKVAQERSAKQRGSHGN